MSDPLAQKLERLESRIEDLEDTVLEIVAASPSQYVVCPPIGRLTDRILAGRKADAVQRSGPTWG